jgi:hypothetical protein
MMHWRAMAHRVHDSRAAGAGQRYIHDRVTGHGKPPIQAAHATQETLES